VPMTTSRRFGEPTKHLEEVTSQTVLKAVTDDVDWAAEISSTVAPRYGVRHGKDGVASFFEAFGSTMEVQKFNPYAFAANDSEVHTVVHCRATGKAIDHDLTTTSDSTMGRSPSTGKRRTPPRRWLR
jgi:hypothetical protein